MTLLIAPLEALTDARLSDPERRVLLALYSFRNKNADTVWPSLEAIADRALIGDQTRISKITSSLAKKGWLTKKKRGFTGGNEYKLDVPANLDSDAKLGANSKMEPNTNSNLDSQTKSNLDSDAKCNEHQIEQQKEQQIKHSPPEPLRDTEPHSISDPKKPKPKKYNYHQDHMTMAEKMAKPVRDRFPSQAIDLEQWADAIRKLNEIDQTPKRQIWDVWQWIQNHQRGDFSWADQIRTPMKLRERDRQQTRYFDVIHNQIQRGIAPVQTFNGVNLDDDLSEEEFYGRLDPEILKKLRAQSADDLHGLEAKRGG